MFSSFIRIFVFVSILCLLGCDRDKIEVYRAPKDTLPSLSSDASSLNTRLKLDWTPPPSWQSQPSTGVRIGSFLIPNPNGPPADVSVILLPGTAGGLLENVNRWRDQIELPPISESDLPSLMQKIDIAGRSALLVELTSLRPIGTPSQSTRILAAILTDQNSSCFFKMMGETSLVSRQRNIFLQFLRSVRIVTPESRKEHVTSPSWKIPKNWEEQPTRAMRKASFLVRGPNHTQADISITSLSGSAGGVLANVNRWRTQINLPPLTEKTLPNQIRHIPLREQQILWVNMLGTQSLSGKTERVRILAAILPHHHETWFFKITGDDSLVSSQEKTFLDFLKTIRFP